MDMRDDPELRFQQVYDEYHAKIFRYLTRIVGQSEAEDLTQEVFVKVGQSLETFRGESQLSTWIGLQPMPRWTGFVNPVFVMGGKSCCGWRTSQKSRRIKTSERVK
jgi:hypothetical protein